jgi:membrane associated rhomboid family serine protease
MYFEDAPAAWIIFLLTIGLSLYALYGNRALYEKMLLHPYSVIHEKKWYQVITSGFLHADITHLIFNMLSFYFFAFTLNATVHNYNFLVIYFGSMILGDLSTIIKKKNDPGYYSLGASGAISGIIFSTILFYPKSKMSIMFFPMPIPSPVFGLLFLVYSYFGSKYSRDLINHEAHYWGALAGIIITILLFPNIIPYFIEQVF